MGKFNLHNLHILQNVWKHYSQSESAESTSQTFIKGVVLQISSGIALQKVHRRAGWQKTVQIHKSAFGGWRNDKTFKKKCMQIWLKNNQMCFGLVFPIVWYMEHVHYWFADENLQWHIWFIFIYIFPSWRSFAKPLKSSWEHIVVWLCQKLQMFGVTQLIYASEEIRLFNYYHY